MTSTRKDRQDSKLQMWVAGSVVVAAATIALLAGLTAQHDGDKVREVKKAPARPVFQPAPAPVEPVRAVEPVAVDELLAGYESFSAPPAPATVEEAVGFPIDPTENLMQRALETYQAREFDHSAAYLDAEIRERPRRAWSHYLLGLALWKADRLDEANVAMEEAANLDPESVKTLVNLSRIRNDQRDFEGALEAARSALKIDGAAAPAHFLEGRSLLNLGRLEDAMTSLTASLEIEPENGHVQNLLGLALMRQGHPDEAVASLERASELEPELAYLWNNLGMALELSGRKEDAVAIYRRGVELDPAHTRVVANLARLEPSLAVVTTPEAEGPLVADGSVAE